uniref:NADH dehydrogenase subunit 6 n=1 Tax=Epidaus famulus TaxID=1524511 RepID=UPI002E775884|nr:NADH dehydrogenase subunit 6 [Epidaus famulus]WQT73254.1 NADH dehydrogenase subunit 6 [Epidaus famulus]
MLMLLMLLSITLSMTFLFMKHPLSMGLILIIQTIIVSLMTGLMIGTFWFSYILLITILSGALVLFIYMASIASNEKFNTSMSMLMLIIGGSVCAPISMWLKEEMSMNNWMNMSNISLINNQVSTLIKMFNTHNMLITLMIISYLFMTMIVISYIVNVFEGPLRTKN